MIYCHIPRTLDFIKSSPTQYGKMNTGMLTKWVHKGEHIKTGRHDVIGYSGKTGIEPIIEVICYRLGTAMGIPMATEELGVVKYMYRRKACQSICNISTDFKCGKELWELEDRVKEPDDKLNDYTYSTIHRLDPSIYPLVYLDYIICNEDRHSRNIAWLCVPQTNSFVISPIYDCGYSLLYDNIPGLLRDFRYSCDTAPCNSPLYSCFKDIELIIKDRHEKLKLYWEAESFKETVNIRGIVESVKIEYKYLTSIHDVDTIKLNDLWFEKIIEMLEWRMRNARNL